MATAQPNQEIAEQAAITRSELKKFARQLRTTVQAVARLEAICEQHGIILEVEPPTHRS